MVLDISLGNSSGLELLHTIQRLRSRLRVLVPSMHGEEHTHGERFKPARPATS
jgi:DNA-binding NarL/FixJ family response regulator